MNSKKFLIPIVSLSLVVVTSIVIACAYYDYTSDFYNSFFAPETSGSPEAAKPFYRSMQSFYSSESVDNAIHIMDSTNIVEWQSYFASKVKADDLKYIIYKSRIGEIDTCIFYLRDNKYPITSELKENSLLAFDDKALVKEFLYYMGYAKRCEPFSTYNPDWWSDDRSDDPRNNKPAMQKHLDGGKKSLVNAKSPFIKERYAFQVTRLLYQMGQYDECINFYNQNSSLFTSNSTILYRSMGYVAASNYKMKKFSEANYLYSIIFDKCDVMKKICFMSFHPQEEADWNGSLALAKNTHEKEVLWHMLGIYVDPLRAMKEIYAINPKSGFLDLLITRAVNINEESFVPSYDEKIDSYELKSQKVNSDLIEFAQKLANSGNTNKPYLWNLVAGYLNIAQGNYKQAEKYLAVTSKGIKGDVLLDEQISAFRIMIRVEEYLKSNQIVENDLAEKLSWLGKEKRHPALRSSCIYNWALSRLCEKYRKWGDIVKAQCLDYKQNMQFYEDDSNINQLIALMDKPKKTSFESFIVSLHPYSKADLCTYIAIRLIYQYKFDEALQQLDRCSGSGSDVLLADPFIIHINDCHDCDFQLPKEVEYTKYTFVKRMIELQNKAQVDTKNAAQYYFLLANGFYNMTYFGNSRTVYQSPIQYYGQIYFEWKDDNDLLKDPKTNCSKALEYYLKAMNASQDKEFKAKCCFMAAKCEQNLYYISEDYNSERPIKSGIYFKQLRDDYSSTKYYKEIINECGYFKMYINQKDIK